MSLADYGPAPTSFNSPFVVFVLPLISLVTILRYSELVIE